MNKRKNILGFTLIELLIVIAIIGILAVAFLPTLLGAPAKGRDTQRIADLQKIQKVLVNSNLENDPYPSITGTITGALLTKAGGDSWATKYLTSFGGTLPADPQPASVGPVIAANGYYYVAAPAGYAFGLYARVETLESANTKCSTLNGAPQTLVTPVIATDACYAILTQ